MKYIKVWEVNQKSRWSVKAKYNTIWTITFSVVMKSISEYAVSEDRSIYLSIMFGQ